MVRRLIINIRGAGGSGKTTLVRGLFASDPGSFPEPWQVWEHSVRPGGSKGPSKTAEWPVYRVQVPALELPVYVQGSYRQAQGGCDTCKDMDAIEEVIWRAATTLRDGHVLFEGMMVSGSAGRWAAFSTRFNKLGLGSYLWCFMRPTKEELIRRVMERNGGKMPQVQYYDENMEKQARSRRAAVSLGTPREMIMDLDAMADRAAVFDQFINGLREREQGLP
jgi:hypothetical protein